MARPDVRTMHIDDLNFNTGLGDAGGVLWLLNLSGWDGAPPVRSDIHDLPLRDGGRMPDSYRSGRSVDLEIYIDHAVRQTTIDALGHLKQVLDYLQSDGQLIVDEDIPKMLYFRRADAIDVEWIDNAVHVTTAIYSGEWRKYSAAINYGATTAFVEDLQGWDLTVGSGGGLGIDLTDGTGINLGKELTGTAGSVGDLEAVNDGDVDTYPTLILDGPTTGSWTSVDIFNYATGERIVINTTVNAGEQLMIDQRAALLSARGIAVSVNGMNRLGAWTHPRTGIRLVPGMNLLRYRVLAGTQGGTVLRAQWRDAWE